MAIDYQRLRNWPFEERIDHYKVRDCMIYALGLGYGSDPLDEAELRYVHEEATCVVPTLLGTVGAPYGWAADPATGIDWLRILHGEHRMRFHAPLAAQGSVRSRTRVTHVVDKGAEKGALIVTLREVSEAESGTPLASVEHVSFCRADGGVGAGDAAPAALPAPPDRTPDHTVLLPTIAQQALWYRLNGDLNPVHVIPRVARSVGFERPVLHGLCTYGMAARALLRVGRQNAHSRENWHLASIATRFSAPFFPGETLRVDIWCAEARWQFCAWAHERGVRVLNNGVAEWLEDVTP